MRIRARSWVMVIMVGLFMANLALPSVAFAQASATATPDCSAYAGLTHKMAGCIRETIDAAADRFFTQIYPDMETTITVVLTLAVIVYGVMISFGMVEQVGRDTFILILKVGSVAFFCANSPWMFKTVTGAMDAAAFAVVGYAPANGAADGAGSDYSQSICMQKMVTQQASADPDKPVITPWLGIDCVLDTIIGIKLPEDSATPPATGNQYFNDVLDHADPTKSQNLQARSLMYFFFSSMATSIFGAILAVVGFFFIMGMLLLVIRCFFIYIAAYMGIAVLIIVSPLIIPLILFPRTKDYFDKWAKLLIGFAMQPVMMLTFLIFSLSAVDLAAFSANYSIMYRIAGDAIRQPHFDLNIYLSAPRHADGTALAAADPNAPVPTYPGVSTCTDCKNIIGDAKKVLAQIKADNPTDAVKKEQDNGGVLDKTIYSQCTDDAIKNDASGALKKACGTVYDFKLITKGINWDLMAKARTNPPVSGATAAEQAKNIQQEVLAALFFVTMVVFVLNGVLAIVPAVVTDLLGDFNQSPNLGKTIGGMGGGGGSQSGFGKILNRVASPFKVGS